MRFEKRSIANCRLASGKDVTVRRWRQPVIVICLIVLLHIFYYFPVIHTICHIEHVLFVYLCFEFVLNLEPFTINEISSTGLHVFTLGTLRQSSNTVAFSIAQCRNPVLWTRNNVVSWENTFQAARNNRTKAKSTCLCLTPFVTCTVFDRDVFDVFLLSRRLVRLALKC